MVNDVGFVISEEVLASGPGTGLITQSFCVAEVLLLYEKGTKKASDIDIRRRMESAPLIKSYPGFVNFYQIHSHNIHLKLTRLELTIERSYQTHCHNICLKLTRLVRKPSC